MRQQCIGIQRPASEARTIPMIFTCEEAAEIWVLLSVVISIIIIIEDNGIVY